MKIDKTGNIHIWYKSDRMDSYTILIGDHVYGSAPDPSIISGYAGSLQEAGYTSESYQQWCKDNPKKVGRIVYSHEELPEPVIGYIRDIINSEK